MSLNGSEQWLVGLPVWEKLSPVTTIYSDGLRPASWHLKQIPKLAILWKSCTTWDVENILNHGITYQPQLVQDFFHQQDDPYVRGDNSCLAFTDHEFQSTVSILIFQGVKS